MSDLRILSLVRIKTEDLQNWKKIATFAFENNNNQKRLTIVFSLNKKNSNAAW